MTQSLAIAESRLLLPAGIDTSVLNTDTNTWAPRLGIAYSPLGKPYVLRGGYGLLYSTDVSGQQPLSANFLTGGRYDRQVLLPGV